VWSCSWPVSWDCLRDRRYDFTVVAWFTAMHVAREAVQMHGTAHLCCERRRWNSEKVNKSTRSPFVTLLSRRAQSGMWSFSGKRVWFTETHTVLIFVFSLTFYLFILFLIQNNGVVYPVKQLDHFQETDTVTSLYSHQHHTHTRLNSHWIASVCCPLLTFSHLNLSPPTYLQRSWIYVDRLTYNACHEPSVTDASNPKKQLY